MIQTLPISKARENLTNLVDNAKTKLDEYVITVNGSPAAVLISADEYESWKETMEIMSDPATLLSINSGQKDFDDGKVVTLEELTQELNPHV